MKTTKKNKDKIFSAYLSHSVVNFESSHPLAETFTRRGHSADDGGVEVRMRNVSEMKQCRDV